MSKPTYDELSEAERCELLARAASSLRSIHPPAHFLCPRANEGESAPANPYRSPADYRAFRLWLDGRGWVVYKSRDDGYDGCTFKYIVYVEDGVGGMVPRDAEVVLENELDYDAECHAVIEAAGRVLELWA